jgi:hypothetical protein
VFAPLKVWNSSIAFENIVGLSLEGGHLCCPSNVMTRKQIETHRGLLKLLEKQIEIRLNHFNNGSNLSNSYLGKGDCFQAHLAIKMSDPLVAMLAATVENILIKIDIDAQRQRAVGCSDWLDPLPVAGRLSARTDAMKPTAIRLTRNQSQTIQRWASCTSSASVWLILPLALP